MKKGLLVLATIAGVILLGNVLIVSAQNGSQAASLKMGRGLMSGTDVYTGTMPFRGGMMGGGMMGTNGMNTAIETAVAQKLGMTVADLNTALKGGQTIDQIAQSKNVSITDLNQVALDAAKSALADQVKSGAITQQQADSQLNRLTTPLLNFGRGRDFGPGKMGDSRGGMGGFFGGMMGPNGAHQQVLAAIAQKLGMTTDELTKALQSGQTLSQLAQSKGIAVADLQKAATDAMKTELDALVKQGTISQQQEDQMLSQMQNMPLQGFGFGFAPRGGHGFGPGQMVPRNSQPNPTTPQGQQG